ncbi:MAG: class I SAM-dependent methyltransferase [Actinomycetota bacterium]
MSDDRLDWIFATRDDRQLADRYDRWAARYDADHDDWDWIGPEQAVRALSTLGQVGTVLDAGCGTGRVGRALHAAGWTGTLVGVDLSAGMLAVAGETGRYERLVQATLTAIPLDDDTVDAVIATGVFTHGHVGPEAFPEVLRVVRPGGWVIITCRDEVWDALEPAADELAAAGHWLLHRRTEPTSLHPGKGDLDDLPQSVVVWQVSDDA